MDGATQSLLSWWDASVFMAMLAASTIIGCYFGCVRTRGPNSDDNDEYLRGGKTMHVVPVSLSLVASFISGITMLGLPAEVYSHGTQYWAVMISNQFVCLTISHVFVPLYIDLKVTSCYQYLEMRFDSKVRKISSFLFVLSILCYIPIVIYVPALALSQVTGVNIHVITPITSLVCIFYTTVGGLRAVVWTDALQIAMMFLVLFVVMFLGIANVGGLQEVWSRADAGGRLQFFNLDPDPLQRTSFFTVFFGLYFQFLAECGVGQGFVQRYLAVPSLKDAQRSVFWFGIGLGLVPVLCISVALLMYAYYNDCDPLSTGRIRESDQLLPLYVLDVAGHIPGLSGLFFAGVFSAALSSMSTGVNALSGVLVEDLLAGCLPRVLSKGAWLRLSSALTGAVCVLLVMLVEKLGGVIQSAFSLSGITSGTMLGLFTLGMFFPRANSKGAICGSLAGLLLTGTLVMFAQAAIARGELWSERLPVSVAGCAFNTSFLLNDTAMATIVSEESDLNPIVRVSFMYYSIIGAAIVWLVGLPVSYLCGPVEYCRPELLVPFFRRFLPPKTNKNEVKPLFRESSKL